MSSKVFYCFQEAAWAGTKGPPKFRGWLHWGSGIEHRS